MRNGTSRHVTLAMVRCSIDFMIPTAFILTDIPEIAAEPSIRTKGDIPQVVAGSVDNLRQSSVSNKPAPTAGASLTSPGMLPRRFEVAETLHRRAHQQAVAFLDDALGVALLDMRVTDHDVVFLAGVDDAFHLFQHGFVLVLPRVAELLRQVAFADQDAADARHIVEYVVEVLDAACILDLQDAKNFTLRIKRPDVGFLVVVLLAEAPVARGCGRTIATDAGGLVARGALESRIAAGAYRIGRFLDRRNMREHDTVATHVEGLLGLPLRHLRPVHRYAGHRRHARHDGGGLGDLRAVEHVLQ